MKTIFTLLLIAMGSVAGFAQTNPAITSFLQNTTTTGTYYLSGNSTTQSNGILVNCQEVEYSNDYAYIHATGVPAYPTGPFQDGNPSNATDQQAIFKIPLNPVENTGTATATTAGSIGVFINGTSLYDYRDGVSWNPNTSSLCGGPGNQNCPGGPNATMDWNRDAVVAEKEGFDCSKGHPANGNYHHHQNPSAFKLDQTVISTICNLYDADGLYTISSSTHSPLLGFAYDGFPIYGAYGYANTDGTGGIVRMRSSYQLKTGTTRANGPDVSTTYPAGYFREDYEFVNHPGEEEYLDIHNGRVCVTPEYPNGIYCYFATVDDQWNSEYPYAVGPTFYGVYDVSNVNSVNEPTTTYVPVTTGYNDADNGDFKANIFPNPSSDFIAVQVIGLTTENLKVELFDVTGKLVKTATINQGATNTYLDTRTLYDGQYQVTISGANVLTSQNILIAK